MAREFKGVVAGEHDGQPMKSALVQIRGEGTKAKILTARTDNSGRFRFRELPAGLYFFVAVTEGFQSVSGCVVIDRRANRSEPAIVRLPLGVWLHQAALDLSSSRMMRRSVSSNRGALPSRYSRSAALISV